jgi:hypothetical protein
MSLYVKFNDFPSLEQNIDKLVYIFLVSEQ